MTIPQITPSSPAVLWLKSKLAVSSPARFMPPAMCAIVIRDRKWISPSTRAATLSVTLQETCVPPSCRMAAGTMPSSACATAMGNPGNTASIMTKMKTAFMAAPNSAHSLPKALDTMAIVSLPSAMTGKPILPLFWKTLPVPTGPIKALPPSRANATGKTVTTPVRTARMMYCRGCPRGSG